MFFRRGKLIALSLAVVATTNAAIAQRNLKDIPDPDPELERETFILPEGFEVNLFAADPLLAKPIQMNFDAQGRLWIASSEVYPHIKPGQEATDKILVLEDTNADGKADKTTAFADGLLIPTGVVPGDGGVYVANSTELIHLRDTDGNGKADERRIVLSGFGTEDTHHLLHTLRWGHDGCLYMNQSIYIHSHIETPRGVRRLNGGGIWRFRPETMELEILCRGFVNPWGHHQNRWGQHFATDGAYGEGINYVFPGAVYVTAPGAERRLRGLNPGSPKHCGLEITSGRHLPEEWRGNMIANDFRAHRVCRFVVREDGSGYASRQEVEVIKSKHVAFRPIDVKMGPDGAIYIADWYNPIIQHGEVDFRDPRRDHVHGRIWRVTAKGRPLVERKKIVGANVEDLLEMLKVEEDWVRLWAKQELKTRPKEDVARKIDQWAKSLPKDDPLATHYRLEALWAVQTIGGVNEDLLQELLRSKDHRARAAAVRVASDWHNRIDDVAAVFAAAVKDEHPQVRLEGVRAWPEVETSHAAEFAAQVLDQPMDRFLDFALWQTMRDLKPHWLPQLEAGKIDFGGNVAHLTFALKAVDSPAIVEVLLKRFAQGQVQARQTASSAALVAQLGNASQLHQLLKVATQPSEQLTTSQRTAILQGLREGTRQRKIRLVGDFDAIAKLVDSEDENLRIAAIRVAGAWRVKSAAQQIEKLAVAGKEPSDALRKAAMEALGDNGDATSLNTLMAVATNGQPAQMRGFAIEQLARVKIEHAARLAAAFLASQAAPSDVEPIVAAILSQKAGPAALSKSLEDKKLPQDIAKVALRAARAAPGNTASLQQALRKSGGLTGAPKEYTPAEIEELVALIDEKGNPHRGEAIYRRDEMQCTKCHAIGGAGGRVGPDLISIGASAPVDYLLKSLVDPNDKVKENFHSVVVETAAGKIFAGIPVRRAGGVLVLRDGNDKEVKVPLAEIEEEREGRSLMPEGLVEPLTRDELVDLTAFLSQLGKDGPFAVGKARIVRRYRKLAHTPQGHRRLNRTSHDTAATDDPALTWQPAYSKVSGELPVTELAPFVIHRGHPAASFVDFDVVVSTPGTIGFQLGDVEGLTLWVDGNPTELQKQFLLDLSQGRHRLTLAVNRQQRQAPLRVQLVDLEGATGEAEIVGDK